MKNLKRIGKALLSVLSFIAFNLLADIFLFNRPLTSYHISSAIFGGIGAGLAAFFLFNRDKSRNAKFSSDLRHS